MKVLAIVLAAIFGAIAVIYLIPGGPLGFHFKHAILFLLLSGLALVWLRFQTRGASAPNLR